MSRRRTEEEWRGILEEQREQGLSDRVCCSRHGTDPSSLKRWRGRLGLGGSRGSKAFAELPAPAAPMGELRVILPNRVELAVGQGWSPDLVAALASRLAVL
jgi:hypothetical protein